MKNLCGKLHASECFLLVTSCYSWLYCLYYNTFIYIIDCLFHDVYKVETCIWNLKPFYKITNSFCAFTFVEKYNSLHHWNLFVCLFVCLFVFTPKVGLCRKLELKHSVPDPDLTFGKAPNFMQKGNHKISVLFHRWIYRLDFWL